MKLSKELLSKDIPFLSPHDTGETVLSLMEEHKVGHLALVENGKYLCLVSERDAYRMESPEMQIGKAWYFSPSVKINGNLLEALERMSSNNLSVLPTVSEDNDYLGVISQSNLINSLSVILGSDRTGSIIVLEMIDHDYLVSEISRIVESNNAQILDLCTYPSKEGHLHIAIKVNADETDHIARSFERFNYRVAITFSNNGVIDEVAQQRWQEIFHYINI